MNKGMKSITNIDLGVKLTEFHRFWWNCVSIGINQEKSKGGPTCQVKEHIPHEHQLEKVLEDTTTKQRVGGHHVGPTGPTYRPTGLWVLLSASALLRRFLHHLRVCIFIVAQGHLIWGSRIDAPPYIYQALPPWGISHWSKSFEKSKTLISSELHHILRHS
jgi:hypothetical protein